MNHINLVRFELVMSVPLENIASGVVLLILWRALTAQFGGIYCVHLQSGLLPEDDRIG